MTVSYLPSNDVLVLKSRPLTKKPNKELGSFKLWWDDDGYIYGINISSYTEELDEFKKNLKTVRLGGIWKGINITDQEIKNIRKELLDKLEERW